MTAHSLEVGQSAPDFELPGDHGDMVKLSDFRGKQVILYFYPKDDTSGCTTQACGFRDTYTDIEAHNAVVIGISPDGVESHQAFKTKHRLPFHLLVDADHAVAETYGVWGEKKMYGKSYMGIIRSHFIIGEDGTLLDVQVKVSPADSIKRALKALQKG
ncbi:MAG: thioredoxin-dependent thiol peroxidase [Chloroflexaceae bacterium]|nr:thioredoxin-dependent thiol peroxidase [Chloroflexaceae bacterium]